jgi:hypothetical protein
MVKEAIPAPGASQQSSSPKKTYRAVGQMVTRSPVVPQERATDSPGSASVGITLKVCIWAFVCVLVSRGTFVRAAVGLSVGAGKLVGVWLGLSVGNGLLVGEGLDFLIVAVEEAPAELLGPVTCAVVFGVATGVGEDLDSVELASGWIRLTGDGVGNDSVRSQPVINRAKNTNIRQIHRCIVSARMPDIKRRLIFPSFFIPNCCFSQSIALGIRPVNRQLSPKLLLHDTLVKKRANRQADG